MFSYQRDFGACYFGACYNLHQNLVEFFSNEDILMQVILLTTLSGMFFHLRHFGACYFVKDNLVHVILLTTFCCIIFY